MEIKQNYKQRVLSSFLEKGRKVNEVFNLCGDKKRNNFSGLKSIKCPICLYTYNVAYRPNLCGHCFCLKCINIWIKTKKECPYCRKKFSYLVYVS